MRYATITGWGKAIPPAILSNADLETIMETSDEWISTRTGIKERRIAEVETSDMAALAGRQAIAAAGKSPEDVDLIVVATCSPDTLLPSAAAWAQTKLGATNAAAFDLNAACSGFLYSLIVATNMIKGGTHKCALVIGSEKLHSFVNFRDRTTAVLFGDGAGAILLEAVEQDEPIGLLSSEMGLEVGTEELLWAPQSGTKSYTDEAVASERAIQMGGSEVFRRAVTMMADSSERVLAEAGWTSEDVDIMIPHQANVRIIDAATRRLGIDESKVFVNIASYGNTSGATIPIALAEALEEGRIQPGAKLVFAAFGAGLTWAAATFQWGDRVTPIETYDVEFPASTRTGVDIIQANLEYFGRNEVVATPSEGAE